MVVEEGGRENVDVRDCEGLKARSSPLAVRGSRPGGRRLLGSELLSFSDLVCVVIAAFT